MGLQSTKISVSIRRDTIELSLSLIQRGHVKTHTHRWQLSVSHEENPHEKPIMLAHGYQTSSL